MFKFKNMGKQILSIVLCVAILVPLGSAPLAAAPIEHTMNFNTILNVVDDYGITILDISELDGQYIYFTRDDHGVTVMGIRPEEGTVEVYRNNGDGLLSYDTMYYEDLGLRLDADESSRGEQTSGTLAIFDGIISLLDGDDLYLGNVYILFDDNLPDEVVTYDESLSHYAMYQPIQPLVHPVITHQFTAAAMSRHGHQRRSIHFLGPTLTERGHTARLYGTTDFRVLSTLSPIRLLATMTVLAVSAALFKPGPVVGMMFRFIGGQTLGINFDVTRYRISVDYARIAVVRGFQLTRGDRQLGYEISFGEIAADAVRTNAAIVYGPTEPGWPHPVFYQPNFLMQQAITRAIQNGV